MKRFTTMSVFACLFALAGAAHATSITFARVAQGVDWTSAGVGGVSGSGSGSIMLSGVSGTVKQAFLYWHGIDEPENGGDGVYDNETITFQDHQITGTSLGDSGTNCWPSSEGSQGTSRAFRADVTALVPGNGTYDLSGLSAKPGHSANGASLIVLFDDGNAEDDRDVVFFEGNDSNMAGFPGEDDGWHATLDGINYSSGTVNAQLHAADGQDFTDNTLTFSSGASTVSILDTNLLWDGVSVPDAGTSRASNGSLWDIHTFDLTSAFGGPGSYTLTMDGQEPVEDCLGLVVLLLDLKAGSIVVTTTTTTTTTTTLAPCGNGVVDRGEQCDLGAANGTAGACCTAACTFRPAGQACRPATGVCDVAEVCTGTSGSCPADQFARAGTACRPGTGCQDEATCNGTSTACPANPFKADGETCDDGDPSTLTSVCKAQKCQGVGVGVQPPPPVVVIPPNAKPAATGIPVTIQLPGGGGKTKVLIEGFASCADLTPPGPDCHTKLCRKLQRLLTNVCGSSALTRVMRPGGTPQIETTLVPVTRKFSRTFRGSKSKTVATTTRLNPLGSLFFKQNGRLQVTGSATVNDAQGRSIDQIFRTLLRRG